MVQFPKIPESAEFPKCEPFRNSGSNLKWKMRPSAQPFLWKWWEWKIISVSNAEHLNSFWYRGQGNSETASCIRVWSLKFAHNPLKLSLTIRKPPHLITDRKSGFVKFCFGSLSKDNGESQRKEKWTLKHSNYGTSFWSFNSIAKRFSM